MQNIETINNFIETKSEDEIKAVSYFNMLYNQMNDNKVLYEKYKIFISYAFASNDSSLEKFFKKNYDESLKANIINELYILNSEEANEMISKLENDDNIEIAKDLLERYDEILFDVKKNYINYILDDISLETLKTNHFDFVIEMLIEQMNLYDALVASKSADENKLKSKIAKNSDKVLDNKLDYISNLEYDGNICDDINEKFNLDTKLDIPEEKKSLIFTKKDEKTTNYINHLISIYKECNDVLNDVILGKKEVDDILDSDDDIDAKNAIIEMQNKAINDNINTLIEIYNFKNGSTYFKENSLEKLKLYLCEIAKYSSFESINNINNFDISNEQKIINSKYIKWLNNELIKDNQNDKKSIKETISSIDINNDEFISQLDSNSLYSEKYYTLIYQRQLSIILKTYLDSLENEKLINDAINIFESLNVQITSNIVGKLNIKVEEIYQEFLKEKSEFIDYANKRIDRVDKLIDLLNKNKEAFNETVKLKNLTDERGKHKKAWKIFYPQAWMNLLNIRTSTREIWQNYLESDNINADKIEQKEIIFDLVDLIVEDNNNYKVRENQYKKYI